MTIQDKINILEACGFQCTLAAMGDTVKVMRGKHYCAVYRITALEFDMREVIDDYGSHKYHEGWQEGQDPSY